MKIYRDYMSLLQTLCTNKEIQQFHIWDIDTLLENDYSITHRVYMTCIGYYDMYNEKLELEIEIKDNLYHIEFPEDERRTSFKTDSIDDIINSIKQEFPEEQVDGSLESPISIIQDSLKETGYNVKTYINPRLDPIITISIEGKNDGGFTYSPLSVSITKDKSYVVEYSKESNSIEYIQTLLHGLITRFGV
jgi:hypothetical protein